MPDPISRRKLIQKFRKFKFSGPYAGGRHLYMVKGELKVRIPNPHKGDISGSLVAKILRQAGISEERWENVK